MTYECMTDEKCKFITIKFKSNAKVTFTNNTKKIIDISNINKNFNLL